MYSVTPRNLFIFFLNLCILEYLGAKQNVRGKHSKLEEEVCIYQNRQGNTYVYLIHGEVCH